ncbi:MAG: hypothetical protein RMN51_03295 [Verrucomicrobiota bacterium]|nr:hypothetical protein [Limisphaera sp.]MDW8381124.1 hypothetical protein [Verrucomicrobiota bacterium]
MSTTAAITRHMLTHPSPVLPVARQSLSSSLTDGRDTCFHMLAAALLYFIARPEALSLDGQLELLSGATAFRSILIRPGRFSAMAKTVSI